MAARTLTHTLVYDDETEHWVCSKCTFILGQGHEKLYARCKGNPKTKTSEGKKKAPKWEKHAIPHTRTTGAGNTIQAAGTFLFDL